MSPPERIKHFIACSLQHLADLSTCRSLLPNPGQPRILHPVSPHRWLTEWETSERVGLGVVSQAMSALGRSGFPHPAAGPGSSPLWRAPLRAPARLAPRPRQGQGGGRCMLCQDKCPVDLPTRLPTGTAFGSRVLPSQPPCPKARPSQPRPPPRICCMAGICANLLMREAPKTQH